MLISAHFGRRGGRHLAALPDSSHVLGGAGTGQRDGARRRSSAAAAGRTDVIAKAADVEGFHVVAACDCFLPACRRLRQGASGKDRNVDAYETSAR